jgi:hypothetical protein
VTFSKKISLSKNPFLSDFSLHPRPDLVFSLLPLKSKSFLHNVDKAAAAVRRGCDQPPYHHAQISAGNFFSGSGKFWVVSCFSFFSLLFVFFWAVFFVGAVFGLLGFRAQVEGVVLYRWWWRGGVWFVWSWCCGGEIRWSGGGDWRSCDGGLLVLS